MEVDRKPSKGGIIMATSVTALGKNISNLDSIPVNKKKRISISIRTLDNGFLLSVDISGQDSNEFVELGIQTLPKLLKAIATFLKGSQNLELEEK